MALGRLGRGRGAAFVLAALALGAGQLVGGAPTTGPDPQGAGPAGGPRPPVAGAPALAVDLDRHVAPEHRRAGVPATSAAAQATDGEAATGAAGTGSCAGAIGSCDGASIPPPADSDVAAAVRSTGSAVPDHPGRYQVDPATGQVVDTGTASLPTEPVDVVVVTTTVPPPVLLPATTTTTAVPPATATGLGSDAGAPVG